MACDGSACPPIDALSGARRGAWPCAHTIVVMQTPPTRHLALQGSTNFRDLGGYAGRDGRSVRWRRLFRSDHLGALSASDIATVSALGLGRVCDLRGAQERTAYPCVLPGVTVIALPIEPTVVQGLQSMLAAGQALTVQARPR